MAVVENLRESLRGMLGAHSPLVLALFGFLGVQSLLSALIMSLAIANLWLTSQQHAELPEMCSLFLTARKVQDTKLVLDGRGCFVSRDASMLTELVVVSIFAFLLTASTLALHAYLYKSQRIQKIRYASIQHRWYWGIALLGIATLLAMFSFAVNTSAGLGSTCSADTLDALVGALHVDKSSPPCSILLESKALPLYASVGLAWISFFLWLPYVWVWLHEATNFY
ncbi:hypothetical protein RI367_003010 [Sorochytrium milnesiophthora]